MKNSLQIFGLLDIITLIRNYMQITPHTTAWSNFSIITLFSVLLYISLFFSACFLLTNRKFGIWLTYTQFPLRIVFAVFSFGFLFSLNHFFGNAQQAYKIIFCILIVLEILRLIITVAAANALKAKGRPA
jgi:hypothetical protein